MIPLTAQQIAEAIDARLVGGGEHGAAGAVTIDSRQVGPGDCFFAIVGGRLDGHGFIASAAQSGATVLVVERVPEGVEARGQLVEVERQADRATLRFRVPEDAGACRVLWGPFNAMQNVAKLVTEMGRLHVYELSPLEPDKPYGYEIVCGEDGEGLRTGIQSLPAE